MARFDVHQGQDADFMGTKGDAEDRFLKACDRWAASRKPLVANAATQRKNDTEEHEARFKLANAAALLAWFMRHEKEQAS